jgi:hypothetical protein
MFIFKVQDAKKHNTKTQNAKYKTHTQAREKEAGAVFCLEKAATQAICAFAFDFTLCVCMFKWDIWSC